MRRAFMDLLKAACECPILLCKPAIYPADVRRSSAGWLLPFHPISDSAQLSKAVVRLYLLVGSHLSERYLAINRRATLRAYLDRLLQAGHQDGGISPDAGRIRNVHA